MQTYVFNADIIPAGMMLCIYAHMHVIDKHDMCKFASMHARSYVYTFVRVRNAT